MRAAALRQDFFFFSLTSLKIISAEILLSLWGDSLQFGSDSPKSTTTHFYIYSKLGSQYRPSRFLVWCYCKGGVPYAVSVFFWPKSTSELLLDFCKFSESCQQIVQVGTLRLNLLAPCRFWNIVSNQPILALLGIILVTQSLTNTLKPPAEDWS